MSPGLYPHYSNDDPLIAAIKRAADLRAELLVDLHRLRDHQAALLHRMRQGLLSRPLPANLQQPMGLEAGLPRALQTRAIAETDFLPSPLVFALDLLPDTGPVAGCDTRPVRAPLKLVYSNGLRCG